MCILAVYYSSVLKVQCMCILVVYWESDKRRCCVILSINIKYN